jgi:small subunit ribosomal protein S20
MANIKSSQKRILIIKRNTERNRKIKNVIKDLVKEIAAKNTKKEPVADTLKKAIKELDSSVSKGVLHWKTAARKKSRLLKKYTQKTA